MPDDIPEVVISPVQDSLVEMSMRITKASYNKSDKSPMKWAAIDSDTEEDLYQERMSLELYQDFDYRIKNNVPIPDEFQDAICEADWCGGTPYLSIAHFKSGSGKVNVPGEVESVFIDGTRLKSKGILYDNPLGRKVFDSLREDLYMEKSGNAEHLPVRISIGFLDIEHKHRSQTGTPEFTFVRDSYGKMCPLCIQGIGGKIYTKGHLIHLALTRVPVNPRTQMSVERSMDEITSERDDAKSIIGELADGLEEKSISSDLLVVRSEDGTAPVEVESPLGIEGCYDPNTNTYNQECVDSVMEKFVGKPRADATVKSFYDAVQKSLAKIYTPVEEEMATKNTQVVEPVEKGVLGIPEKKFEFAGISGDGTNTEPSPVPIKAKKTDEEGEEEMEKKSALDKSFEQLKTMLTSGKSADEIQKAFNALGKTVEETYTPPAPTTADIAEIVRSTMAEALKPIAVELATLKAQVGKGSNTVSSGERVTSRALNLGGVRPEDLIQKSQGGQGIQGKKLSQIEKLAYKSTGAISE